MSKTLVIGTIAIVFLALALGGIFLWQMQPASPDASQGGSSPPAPSPTPESQAKVLDTSDWQSKVKSCIDNLSLLDSILPQLENHRADMDYKPMEGTLEIAGTSRGCITLPEDLYPRSKREFIAENNAALGYVSNWEEVCGGVHVGPIGDNCTGDGYEAVGNGTVLFKAKSVVADVPDINFRFIIK